MENVSEILLQIRKNTILTQTELAQWVGTSLASIVRWENGTAEPSPAQLKRLHDIQMQIENGKITKQKLNNGSGFASSGARQSVLPLFDQQPQVELLPSTGPPLIEQILNTDNFFTNDTIDATSISELCTNLEVNTTDTPPQSGMSAGKNTYTYDAHTYHTKVPPQGIAELLKHYLPNGGLVLDPFAGSGMTGVACRVLGYNCILNELSPAASFIARQFTSHIDPSLFQAGVAVLLQELDELRQHLYTTYHRDTGEVVEVEYYIWSYNAICNHCSENFLVWDHCRKYGNSVREHKILSKFSCPHCGNTVKKSTLQRTDAQPVMVAYRNGNRIDTHPLEEHDYDVLKHIESSDLLIDDFYPKTSLYQGINLRQPMRHGLDQIDKFYTLRNLIAMNHLWVTIHRIQDKELVAFMAFVFTSLYQRVTKLSEYRFWGGSGNMARFNVPFVFKEANVFTTFERKAKTIYDHLTTTSSQYTGNCTIVNGSATQLNYLPNDSVDLVFTDPPFGSNINYSEMNILWEAWLGQFTETTEEAIVNKYQKKGITEYQSLISRSLTECYRVLKPGGWMLIVFMNSSTEVWEALRQAISDVSFQIIQVDIFDKQHSTFKQLVSENTVGADLVIHCRKDKVTHSTARQKHKTTYHKSIIKYLTEIDIAKYRVEYIHVDREDEVDFSRMYAEWTAQALTNNIQMVDYSEFRHLAQNWLFGEEQ